VVCSAASIPTIGDSQNGWSNNEELPIDPMAVKGDTYRNMCVYIYMGYIYMGFPWILPCIYGIYTWIYMDIRGIYGGITV
jgi:hypothetical protein